MMFDEMDVVTLDIPLLIRLFEYAREEAQTDVDLHEVATRMIEMTRDGHQLTMDDYEGIIGTDAIHDDEYEAGHDENEHIGRVKHLAGL